MVATEEFSRANVEQSLSLLLVLCVDSLLLFIWRYFLLLFFVDEFFDNDSPWVCFFVLCCISLNFLRHFRIYLTDFKFLQFIMYLPFYWRNWIQQSPIFFWWFQTQHYFSSRPWCMFSPNTGSVVATGVVGPRPAPLPIPETIDHLEAKKKPTGMGRVPPQRYCTPSKCPDPTLLLWPGLIFKVGSPLPGGWMGPPRSPPPTPWGAYPGPFWVYFLFYLDFLEVPMDSPPPLPGVPSGWVGSWCWKEDWGRFGSCNDKAGSLSANCSARLKPPRARPAQSARVELSLVVFYTRKNLEFKYRRNRETICVFKGHPISAEVVYVWLLFSK